MITERKITTLFPFHTEVFDTPEKRAAAAAKTPGERQTMIQNLVFRYPGFEEVVGNLVSFHTPVGEGHAQCGYAGGLVGDSRSGKTTIVSALRQMPPHMPQKQGDGSFQYPVAFVQAFSNMNKQDFVSGIYDATEAPSVPRMTRDTVRDLGRRRVLMSGVKLLIVDDAHFIFEARRDVKEGVVSIMKELLDKRLCNILLVAMDSIDRGLLDFVQLYRRGHFPAQRIKDYDKTSMIDKVEYLGFLKGVSKRMPFAEETDFGSEELFPHFIEQTNGLKGATMDIIIDAGNIALDARAPRVTRQHLYEACFKRILPGQKTVPFARAA